MTRNQTRHMFQYFVESCTLASKIHERTQLHYVCYTLYADDTLLLAHSSNAVHQMLRICDEFATECDMKTAAHT